MPNSAISTIQAQLDAQRSGLSSPLGATSPMLPPGLVAFRGNLKTPGAGSPTAFEDLIQDAARRHDVDPKLIKAVIRTESNFNPNAVSGAGAKGLMQIMDFNSRAMGVTNPFDPAQNIDAGARMLKGHVARYGELPKALAAYNAGGPTVDKYGGVPPFRETQTYVTRVLDALRGYQSSSADSKGVNQESDR
jgi:soluble lytic murein transglycosylase-like protein